MSRVIPDTKQVGKEPQYVIRASNGLYLYEVVTGKGVREYSSWVAGKENAIRFFSLASANEWRDFVSGLEGIVAEVEEIQ